MTDTALIEKVERKQFMVKMWKVIFHNDDYTPMYFVEEVLTQMFGKTAEEATAIALKIHNTGRGVVAEYTKEIALQKASDAVKVARFHGHPLKATAEES